MIQGVILKFEQTGQGELRTVPYVRRFTNDDKIGDILEWVKSIDPKKGVHDVYFTKPSVTKQVTVNAKSKLGIDLLK